MGWWPGGDNAKIYFRARGFDWIRLATSEGGHF
jgi:hypothetical protein